MLITLISEATRRRIGLPALAQWNAATEQGRELSAVERDNANNDLAGRALETNTTANNVKSKTKRLPRRIYKSN